MRKRGEAAQNPAAQRYRSQAAVVDTTAGGQIPLQLRRDSRGIGGAMADQRHLDGERHAGHVGVERADEAPVVVDQRVLRVHHDALVFPELEARRHPAAVVRLGRVLNDGHVREGGHQDLHVHPACPSLHEGVTTHQRRSSFQSIHGYSMPPESEKESGSQRTGSWRTLQA